MPGAPPPPRPDADEEELRTEPRRLPRPALLVVAACAVAALAAVGVLVLHGRNAPHPHAAATSSVTAVPAVTAGSAPTAVSTANARPAAGGLAVAVHCPPDASCSAVRDLPLTTTSALRAVLPDAIVTSSVSVLVNRTGHFEPDLATRRIEALAGDSRTLSLRIDSAPPGTLPAETRVVRVTDDATGASAVGRVGGFVVTGTLSGPSPTSGAARAAALRALRRLVTATALTDPQ